MLELSPAYGQLWEIRIKSNKMAKDAADLVHKQRADGRIMKKKEAGELVGSKSSPGHRNQHVWETRQEVAPL